jgi:hypothetical protein
MHLAGGFEPVVAGGAQAHRAAIQTALDRGWEAVLVLEPEAVPLLDGGESLAEIASLPPQAEIVHLSGVRCADFIGETVRPGLLRVRRGLRPGSATIYRRPIYQPALAALEGAGEDTGFLDRLCARWQTDIRRHVYAVQPWPFVGEDSPMEQVFRREPIWIDRNCAPTASRLLVSRFHQFIVSLVAKNGTHTLKHLVGITEPEIALRLARGMGPHPAAGFAANGKWMINPEDGQHRKYDGYVKFFVWRDPLDRLRSVVRWMVGNGAEWSHGRWRVMIEEGLTELSWLRRNFEALVDAELAFRAAPLIDQHVRPQNATFECIPVQIIVPLPRLHAFMNEKFGIFPLVENRSDPLLLGDELERSLGRLVERHYMDDYRILESGVPVYGGAVQRAAVD